MIKRTAFILSLILSLACASQGQVMMLFTQDSLMNISSPLSIDSLFYWFDASQGVTDSLGGAIANNEGVGRWENLSSRANDLVSQSTTEPIWKATGGPGSMPCIQFAGTSPATFLQEESNSYWNSDNITVFAVKKVTNATANQQEYFLSRNAVIQQFGFYGENTANSYWETVYISPNGSTIHYDMWTPKSTTWRLLSYTLETATDVSSLYIDGSSQTRNFNDTQTGINDGNNKGRIGVRDQSVAEVIVYSKALSAAERGAIENYLNKKYDLY